MRKILFAICLLSVCCLTGCSTKALHMPSEEEILAKVEEIVPVEYEHIDTVKEKNCTTCYFKCKDRDLTFVAQGYVTDNIGFIPMPQCMLGYTPVISVGYWHQVQDMHYVDIKALFQDTEILKRAWDAKGRKDVDVVLRDEEDLNLFVDLVMQGEEIVEKELEYVDESVLVKNPLVYYRVMIPYIQVYNSGKTEDRERTCIEFASDSTLEKDQLMAEIKQAIKEINKVITDDGNTVIFKLDENE